MSSPPTSSPPPQPPTDEDNTSSPPLQTEGDSTTHGKRADFWPTVFRCMEVKPQVNYEMLAKEMGYKSAKVASDCYSKKLKKLGVERIGPKTKQAAKTTGALKVSKPNATKDSVLKKTRGRKPAVKKVEQEDGLEKVAEAT